MSKPSELMVIAAGFSAVLCKADINEIKRLYKHNEKYNEECTERYLRCESHCWHNNGVVVSTETKGLDDED